jgi:opacity protein-like surface antigen
MKNLLAVSALLLTMAASVLAQSSAKAGPRAGDEITGLYSFVHEGEFVQIEVNEGKVTGVVSRFKNDDPDEADFVDQYFEQASLQGATLSFRTRPADGVWFEFSGVVERGPTKTPADEGYWNVRGTLTELRTLAEGKVSRKVQALTLKSFPQDTEPIPATESEKIE